MLFFITYVGLLPLLTFFFLDIRYIVDRLTIPLPPLLFTPYGFIGVLLDEHKVFSRLWGSPPLRLSEMRETLFSIIVLGISLHAYISWKHCSGVKKHFLQDVVT